MAEPGEPHGKELLGIIADFHVSPAERDKVIEKIENLGGTVVRSRTVFAPDIRAVPETDPENPGLIDMDAFIVAGYEAGMNTVTAKRYWTVGRQICDRVSENEPYYRRVAYSSDTIDLNLIAKHLRDIEAGEYKSRGLGETSWNFFASLINSRLAEPDGTPMFLRWDPDIHPSLSNTVTGVTARAALARRYETVEQNF